MEDDHASVLVRLEKKITNLREKEVLAKESVVEEYKSSDDFQKAMEQAAFKYFDEGFNLFKKQIKHLHSELDIQDLQIDPSWLRRMRRKRRLSWITTLIPSRHHNR